MIRTLAAVSIPAMSALVFSWPTRVFAQAAKTPENFQEAAANNTPDFRVYVFFAYGAVCLLLFLFSLRTLVQSKRLEERVDDLEERLAIASAARNLPGKGEPTDSPG